VEQEIVIAIVIQGDATGLLLTPIQVLALVTLPSTTRTDSVATVQPIAQSGRSDRHLGRAAAHVRQPQVRSVERGHLSSCRDPRHHVVCIVNPLSSPITERDGEGLDDSVRCGKAEVRRVGHGRDDRG